MDLMVDQPMRLAYLADAYSSLHQTDKATECAQLALTSASDYGQRGTSAWAHWILGEVTATADELMKAEECYRQAMALASDLEMAPLLAHCHASLGKHQLRAKNYEEGRNHLATATDAYRKLGMRWGEEP